MRDGCNDIAMGECEESVNKGARGGRVTRFPRICRLYDNTQVYDNDACFKG